MLGTMNNNGFFYTTFNPDELNRKSFSSMIMRLFPNGSAPLYYLTGEIGKARAVAASHGYFTKHMAYTLLTVDDATDLVAGDTTLVVDSTVGVAVGMTFQSAVTREIIRVNTVTNATTLEIDRSFGRVAAGAILDDAVLYPVGNSHTEASQRPASRNLTSVYVPNYTVIIRNAWSISNTARASLAEAGFNNIAETKQDAVEFHSTDIESNLLYGQAKAPVADATTGKLIHATQGLVDSVYEHANANVVTAAGTTTYSQLVDLVEGPFTYSSNKMGNGLKERVIIGDSKAIKVIHDIGRLNGEVTQSTETTTFGLQYQDFKFYKGRIRLLEHPLLNELAPAAGVAIIVDLNSMALAYMEGRDVKKEEYDGSGDSTDSGIDASGGSFTTEFATEFRSPHTCGIINGLTAGAEG